VSACLKGFVTVVIF